MKSLIVAAAVLATGLVASAKAGEVSKSTLGNMGFGAVSTMSDAEGMAIRGKGTSASVWGESTANYGNRHGLNTSTNGYEASASHHHGSSLAGGANLSAAGNVSNHGYNVNFAGGGSIAFAK
jgi:hypothetical protein